MVGIMDNGHQMELKKTELENVNGGVDIYFAVENGKGKCYVHGESFDHAIDAQQRAREIARRTGQRHIEEIRKDSYEAARLASIEDMKSLL